jgi:thiamine biosynthesis lipoprotein
LTATSARAPTASWPAIGTTALVRVADPAALDFARALLAAELDQIDRAASRFRTDSELEQVNAASGRHTRIGPLLQEAIAVALSAAEISGGAVDPTLGESIRLLESELPHGPRRVISARRCSGWRQVELFRDPPRVRLPAGMRLDLGATAKALAADRAAQAIVAKTGSGVLVSLGGDIATAGPAPTGGWPIHVTDDHRSLPSAPGQTVTIQGGALATSSTTVRRWRRGGAAMHHLIDPDTGLPAAGPWRTVSVTAMSCVYANVASTAAIVLGAAAPAWLARRGLAARMVAADGRVLRLGGWPENR